MSSWVWRMVANIVCEQELGPHESAAVAPQTNHYLHETRQCYDPATTGPPQARAGRAKSCGSRSALEPGRDMNQETTEPLQTLLQGDVHSRYGKMALRPEIRREIRAHRRRRWHHRRWEPYLN
jgi:hypothetical protein